MRAQSLVFALTVFALAAAAVFGCFVANDLVLPSPEAGAPEAAGGCNHKLIPTRPTEPDGTDAPIVFAVERVAFENRDKSITIAGIDLDNACSCEGDGVETCRSPGKKCDGPDGIDNALSSLAGTLPQKLSLEQTINTNAATRHGGMLIKVGAYNHESNDATVTVGFFPSRGAYALKTDGGAMFLDDAGKRWSYDPAFASNEGEFSKLTFFGYVRDDVLVAELKGSLPLAGLTIEMQTGSLIAPIKKDPLRIEGGLIVGRWPITSMASALGNFSVQNIFGDASPGTPVCEQPEFLAFAVPQLCDQADIMANPADDRSDQRCDALSFAIGFDASEAELGDPVPIEPVAQCPDAGPIVCP
jgi:hypothetical protein